MKKYQQCALARQIVPRTCALITNDWACEAKSVNIAENKVFAHDELVVFGVPSYGGRVPVPAAQGIAKMHGDNTPAVLIVTYGNRAYDDTLLELQNIVEKNGFAVLAAAAFVTEHSIMHSVAHGRPDEKDIDEIHKFAQNAWAKISGCQADQNITRLKLPGKTPYVIYNGIPLKPQATNACTKCGICAEQCPTGAIAQDSPNKTDKNVCVSCMRCIKICPNGARRLNPLMLSVAEKGFAKKCSERKEPEIFI
ncbi:MAG: 4Fe-4S binding protein [Clostridia bacterium]